MILEDKAKRLMEKPGETKAESIKFFMRHIEKKEGKEGRKKVEKKLKELGYPVNLEELKPFQWEKEGLAVLILLIAKEIFNWTEKDIFEIGEEEPKSSFIMKILMKYFVALERTLQEVPKYWRKFYNFGSIEVADLNKEEQYFILRVHGYDFDPVMCHHHAGFFLTMARFLIKSKNISIKETKCAYKEGDYHEYTIKWE